MIHPHDTHPAPRAHSPDLSRSCIHGPVRRRITHTVVVEGVSIELVTLGYREAASIVGRRLDRAACERIVLAAYPQVAEAARQSEAADPGVWLRERFRFMPGVVEDLAGEALRLAGLKVDVPGRQEVEDARHAVAHAREAGRLPAWSLVSAAFPTRHPGLRLVGAPVVHRPPCAGHGRGPSRPRARRARRSARCSRAGPDAGDSGESEPPGGLVAGRAGAAR